MSEAEDRREKLRAIAKRDCGSVGCYKGCPIGIGSCGYRLNSKDSPPTVAKRWLLAEYGEGQV